MTIFRRLICSCVLALLAFRGFQIRPLATGEPSAATRGLRQVTGLRPATARLAQGKAEEPAQSSEELKNSCRQFVQEFYDWYLPKARTAKERPSDIVLKSRSYVLSRELQRELKADSDAQAKSKDELVGLDFDPFLNTQDPDFKSCTVEKITPKNSSSSSYWADVVCVFPGADASKEHVMPELVHDQGKWVFVNFHYQEGPKKYDLLSMLKSLRARKP